MARKRFGRKGRFYGGRGRGRRGHSSAGIKATDILLGGALYGLARPYVANMLPTMFSFGPVDSDNVIIGGAGYLLSKNSNKIIKSMGLVAMGGEAGIITSQLASGMKTTSSSFNW